MKKLNHLRFALFISTISTSAFADRSAQVIHREVLETCYEAKPVERHEAVDGVRGNYGYTTAANPCSYDEFLGQTQSLPFTIRSKVLFIVQNANGTTSTQTVETSSPSWFTHRQIETCETRNHFLIEAFNVLSEYAKTRLMPVCAK